MSNHLLREFSIFASNQCWMSDYSMNRKTVRFGEAQKRTTSFQEIVLFIPVSAPLTTGSAQWRNQIEGRALGFYRRTLTTPFLLRFTPIWLLRMSENEKNIEKSKFFISDFFSACQNGINMRFSILFHFFFFCFSFLGIQTKLQSFDLADSIIIILQSCRSTQKHKIGAQLCTITGTLQLGFFFFFFLLVFLVIGRLSNGLALWLFLQIEGNGGIREFNVVFLSSICCDSFASRDVQRKIGVVRVVYHTRRLHQLSHISCFANCEFQKALHGYHISLMMCQKNNFIYLR